MKKTYVVIGLGRFGTAIASRPLRLLPLVASTSPKVGGLGNPRKVSGFARGSPFGGAGERMRD